MEAYQDIVTRLSQQLAEVDANIDKPLADVANKYRLTAETICKAILVWHGTEPQGLLEKLIADAAKKIEGVENARDASMFKSEIRYLQSVGNIYSHDGSASDFVNNESQSAAFDALVKIVRIIFFAEGDLDAPNLPKTIAARFPTRVLGRGQYENPRGTRSGQALFSEATGRNEDCAIRPRYSSSL